MGEFSSACLAVEGLAEPSLQLRHFAHTLIGIGQPIGKVLTLKRLFREQLMQARLLLRKCVALRTEHEIFVTVLDQAGSCTYRPPRLSRSVFRCRGGAMSDPVPVRRRRMR
jgi:hypothetical protein